MPTYKAPLRDMRFVLYELLGIEGLRALPEGDGFGPDLVDPVLEEAAKLAEQVLLPLNRSGDEEGCVLENGVVRTPKGFREAYRTYAEGGWTSLACDPEFGGQGLPHALAVFVEEMVCATNLSFSLYPGLTFGAYSALHAHASDEVKQRFLPKLVDGSWTGAMCLTEPHSGSDLGLVRTRAVPQADGTYRITGTKIFISAGDHDLSENIVHLVLARLPDAPRATKGLSLFAVPKLLTDEHGRPAVRNAVTCGSIEHKMGIKASATCVINFDDATGWLVGEPHRGMAAMFTMMNTERLAVGVQGLGIAEAVYQNAAVYARERLQGRSVAGARDPEKTADPIIVHPDVRRMLLTMRAYAEGMRALGQWVAQALDRRERDPDPEARAAADEFVGLMTPVVKALFTDIGVECASLGIQVFGGHGYIREHGMEQYLRDARIGPIYEGTNGIQALDLVGRKLPMCSGALAERFFAPVEEFIAAANAQPALAEFVRPLGVALDRLRGVTDWILKAGGADPEESAAAATEYLRLFGLVALGYMWARSAAVALPAAGGPEAGFYQAKLNLARFYVQRLLPQTEALASAILAGGRAIRAFEEAAF
ncbi:MAG TPA: acyl-CoA dehydrogenase C-terminal domain-containing protein [Alphaproteobacteria bacterium]|nr:acyl-CoA dehydrogenase C-terminal domain-containing protein [Alphaproteobacteria bacterium]